jgi:hypothetical protein
MVVKPELARVTRMGRADDSSVPKDDLNSSARSCRIRSLKFTLVTSKSIPMPTSSAVLTISHFRHDRMTRGANATENQKTSPIFAINVRGCRKCVPLNVER